MRAKTFDAVEKAIAEEGVSGVMFAVMAVMQNVIDEIDRPFVNEKLAKVWKKGQVVIRKAIAELPKSKGIK